MSRELRVGLLTIVALAVFGVGAFLVGERSNLFRRTADFSVRFENVGGLASGNSVQLNGVSVGSVEEVVLPESAEESLLTVWISVDRRYASRVRADSEARIKTLGLLGDKFVEIASGSPDAPAIPSGGEIPAAPPTDVDRLIASGEDLVENVVAIAVSLRTILANMEQGRGILGQLLTNDEKVAAAKESVISSLASLDRILGRIESGEGTLGALIHDETLGERLNASLNRFDSVLGRIESGDGALPALLNDPSTRDRVESLLDKLGKTADGLSAFTEGLGEGDGLLVRLLQDDEYGREVSEDLQQLMHNLNELSGKLERGDGTLGMVINDPALYQAVDDIVLGINESDLLRWAIRNRQKKGIKKRALEEEAAEEGAVSQPEQERPQG